jgi:hypothetical protein
MSKGRPKPSLHRLSRELPSKADVESLANEIAGASDRSCALILAAFIDRTLEILILGRFLPMSAKEYAQLFEERNAVLGTLSAKIILAQALGLLNRQQQIELSLIRSIRNTFAHATRPITFQNELISKECQKLPQYKPDDELDRKFSTERRTFVTAVFSLLVQIIAATDVAKTPESSPHKS